MTDEEMSELAECLADACETAIAAGLKVKPVNDPYVHNGLDDDSCNCPLGYLLGESYPMFPNNDLIRRGFMCGYDGYKPKPGIDVDLRAFALGKLFRELYP